MRQTGLFTKTRKEAPKDEVSKNAQLLIRAGFIHKEMAGVYDMLPLGLRVIKKIEQIIREEMNAIGGQEIEMTTLQGKDIWERAGKWSDDAVDVWFKTKLKNETELGLAFSHEEVIAEMLRNHISSYKDLPQYVYQFQTKFRNELRAKSGIMRGREFLMKDMYSFNRSVEELNDFYDKSLHAYKNVFQRVGLGDVTYVTMADGSVFGDRSHEFQTLSDAGEDIIHINDKEKIAINDEIFEDTISKLNLNKEDFSRTEKSIEVGNIFPIEDKVAQKLNFTFTDENNKPQPIIMGSYGIGLGRVMGTVVEVLSDDKGIVWPESIAPFAVHLVNVSADNDEAIAYADGLYAELTEKGIEVLYDDRVLRAGEKLSDADLIGIPHRFVVGKQSASDATVEYTHRQSGETRNVSRDESLSLVK